MKKNAASPVPPSNPQGQPQAWPGQPGQPVYPYPAQPNTAAPQGGVPSYQPAPNPAQAAPVQGTPVQGIPVQGAPVQGAPVYQPTVASAQGVPAYQQQATPAQAIPYQGAPTQAAPVQGAPVQAAPAQATPVYIQQTAPTQAPYKQQAMPVAPGQAPLRQAQDSEAFFGSKIVGVIAALLVLSGLILLGASFIPQLPDIAKAVFIFLFAVLLTGGGAFLVTKSRNVFTYALFVSGMAAFFVAVWASWAFFGLFDHTTALVVSGVWMAVTIGLLIYTRTWPLAIALCAATGLFGISFLEGDMVRQATSYDYIAINLQPWMAAAFILAGLYIVALGFVGMKLAIDSTLPDKSNLKTVHNKVLASFFTAEAALFFAGIASSWEYAQGAMLVLLISILIVAARSPLPAPLHSNQPAWRINEIVVFFVVALGFALTAVSFDKSLFTVITYGLFTIGAMALGAIRAFDRTKAGYIHPHPAIPVLFAISLTGVVVNYLCGIPFDNVSSYVWSAVAILCALVTIAAGFWFKDKPLRLCGLVITLLCILKIALIDLSGDALTHAVALVVAGLVCFGISALYTYANKRLS